MRKAFVLLIGLAILLSAAQAPANVKKVDRMTGDGSVGGGVTYSFVLRCDATGSNNLEVSWGSDNRFYLDTLTEPSCYYDESLLPNPPRADFNTYYGKGTGRYNDVPDAKVEFTFKDYGEPGWIDTADIKITDSSGNSVLSESGYLKNGNNQAH